MTEPIHRDVNGTKVTWRDYVDTRLDSIDVVLKLEHEYIDKQALILKEIINSHNDTELVKFDALDKSIKLAYEMLNVRLETLNHLKEEVSKNNDTYTTKIEHQLLIDRIDAFDRRTNDDIRSLRESRALLEGKASQESVAKAQTYAFIGVVIGGTSLMCGGFSLFIAVTSLILRFLGL